MFVFSRLIDCGHTFCHQCIVVWFNATFRRQRTSLPGGLGDLAFMINYACPICQTEVAKFPIENYAVKSFIDAVTPVGVADDVVRTGNPAEEDRLLTQLLAHLV
jgi:hypothetical protein